MYTISKYQRHLDFDRLLRRASPPGNFGVSGTPPSYQGQKGPKSEKLLGESGVNHPWEHGDLH